MRYKFETEIGVDCKPAGGNEVKAVDEKSEWNRGVDEARDLVTGLALWPGHYS